MRSGSRREHYGPFFLDEGGRAVLQQFAQAVYENWLNGTPINRVLVGVPFTDYRSKLYYKMFMMYGEGKLEFDLTLMDDESDKPLDLSKLANKYSKEV